MQELVAGGVDICTCSLPEAASLIEAAKARPLAIMADQRDPKFPNVPTLKESGFAWTIGAWRGIVVPKGTPAEIVSRLEQAIAKGVKTPEFVEFMKNRGYGVLYKPSKEFAQFMAEGDRSMGQLMKEVGLAK
jgi:tripartite-type tricarboxylate transporter receptor subunit TctC